MADIPATGTTTAAEPLEANVSYFRPWLTELHVARSPASASSQQLLVVASTRLEFGDRGQVTLSKVIRPDRNQPATSGAGGTVVGDVPLTELLPYKGKAIELQVGLLRLRTDPSLDAEIQTLVDLSALIRPPLACRLADAEVLAAGVQRLVEVGDATVDLGFVRTVGSSSDATGIRPGYVAVVRADSAEIQAAAPSVVDNRLTFLRDGQAVPLSGRDYMLLRVEGRRERDDWKFPDIQDLLNDAVEAAARGEQEAFDAFKRVLLTKVLQSPDLTVADRRRVALAIKQELDDLQALHLGSLGPHPHPPDSSDIPGPAGPTSTKVESIVRERAISQSEAISLTHLTTVESLLAHD